MRIQGIKGIKGIKGIEGLKRGVRLHLHQALQAWKKKASTK